MRHSVVFCHFMIVYKTRHLTQSYVYRFHSKVNIDANGQLQQSGATKIIHPVCESELRKNGDLSTLSEIYRVAQKDSSSSQQAGIISCRRYLH